MISIESVRASGPEQLREIAEDIRQKIVSTCLMNGGHLGASLGAVELALALHHVFESPKDTLVWDVGHQAYAHKLVTGRWEAFSGLRTTDGISGFLSREESPHDAFGAGHSSTSLSAALGIAWAKKRLPQTETNWTIGVIGDGGLTAGLALEALNNVRATQTAPLLVVLNDNQMSISANIGAIPAILEGGHAREFFELFGFDYVGPVDGHDLPTLIGTLQGIRDHYAGKPILLHAYTQKGKGYPPAEEQPVNFHGISPVQAKVEQKTSEPKPPGQSWSEAFGDALCALALKDSRVVAITAAMPDGTGLSRFARENPTKFFDVGIAEPHAVTFAAGLATQGVRPVVAIYSTFMQRAIDEIIHDVALQKLPVVLALDRAGIVGADGPTHHGAFDIAYLRMIPGMTVTAPSCIDDLGVLLHQAMQTTGPFSLRYPRGSGQQSLPQPLQDGLRWHSKAAQPEAIVVALGSAALRAEKATAKAIGNGAKITVISTIYVKPVSRELVSYLDAYPTARLLVLEEGVVRGGFGQQLISECLPRQEKVELVGYPDRFIPHGAVVDLEEALGLSVDGLQSTIERLLLGNTHEKAP